MKYCRTPCYRKAKPNMTGSTAESLSEQILIEIEDELANLSGQELPDHMYHTIRRLVAKYLSSICLTDTRTSVSLPDAIEAAIHCPDGALRRIAALFVIRIAGTPGILTEQDGGSPLKRNVVQLIEKTLPDFSKKLGLDQKSQTYAKYDVLRELHSQICEELAVLGRLTPDVRHLLAHQQEVMRIIGSDKASTYLRPYDAKRIKASLSHIFNALRDIIEISDSTFGQRVVDLEGFIASEVSWTKSFSTFLNRKYYSRFLQIVVDGLKKLELDAKDRFLCDIHTKRSGKDIAEKHYPLHEIGRIVKVSVILANSGPGLALDVTGELSSDSLSIQFDSHVPVGDIAPGDYPLSFEIMPSEACQQVSLTVMVSWLEVGRSDRKSFVFDLKLIGQDSTVPWKSLSSHQPYSTEVAEGAEFVGRASKVLSISSRFLMDRMGSSFITGQKRVGKTSLARAVERVVLDSGGPNYASLYLEYGQYSRMDPVDTVESLGQEIFEFLHSHLPADSAPQQVPNFRGSLAPLNKLADLLLKVAPNKRFIIILDEFDEIHPEMYRFGPLAETFFTNLRALTAKKNIALLLVGGEKMPFVMSAQGDQLNKVVSERLDYFVRGDEWEDYKELVTRPVQGHLNWMDSAIQRVFDLTNGHPYYTKLFCSHVFTIAVRERDTEITDSDVKHCANKLAAELDSNSFAHLWKDGISEDRERAEVLELNRRRVLSACARAQRAKLPLSLETISQSKAALRISVAEVAPIVNDFVRRGILIENKDSKLYAFSIPLFERWLEETGITRLMSDTLSEEYESVEEEAEQSARVTSAELVDLTDRWQLYRGNKIGTDDVRAWLEQVQLNRDQRLLFKLLQYLRFVTKLEIREALKQAHSLLGDRLPPLFQEKHSDRRKDVLVTWVDGPGKSGNVYAGLYAEENKIHSKCLTAPEAFSKALTEHEESFGSSVAAVVIVDDFIGTGDSLSKNLKNFVAQNSRYLKERGVRLLALAITATSKGAQVVREQIDKLDNDASLHVVEPIVEKHFAFPDGLGFWTSAEEKGRAKELCQRVGSQIHRTNPLGYGNQGLLLVFPDTCPNNTLPILHGESPEPNKWRAIFPRPRH